MFYKKNIPHGLLVLVVVISILSGLLGGALIDQLLGFNRDKDDNGHLIQKITEKKVYVEESSVIKTVKKVSPAVVSIVVTKNLPLYKKRSINPNDFFNNPFFGSPFATPELDRDSKGNVKSIPKKVGGGSGFIVTADGLVVTNKHVVLDAKADYTVVMNDGKEYSAEVISRDPMNDIAVVKMKGKDKKELINLPTVELGDSSKLQIGQRVVAIGNALSKFENTVTTGVISAKGRDIIASGSVSKAESLVNLLQTDAAINPGNSGGPLVNLDGKVIGINTAVASGAQGIGFAIAINDVKSVISSIKEYGKIVRPFLGVRYMLIDEDKAKELKIDIKEGGALLVGDEKKGSFAVIPGGPADKAGLKIKDVIMEVDGKKINAENNLQKLISTKKPGDEVKLKVWRSGKVITVKAELAEAK